MPRATMVEGPSFTIRTSFAYAAAVKIDARRSSVPSMLKNARFESDSTVRWLFLSLFRRLPRRYATPSRRAGVIGAGRFAHDTMIGYSAQLAHCELPLLSI